MAPSKRKKQRRYLKKWMEKRGSMSLNMVIISLYEERIHPDDLPIKLAHVLLARLFKYGRPVIQRIVYALVKTGYFQEFLDIRHELANELYYEASVPTTAFVKGLIQLAETLAGLKSYSRQQLEMFDFDKHYGSYPKKLKALLEDAFGFPEIPESHLHYHLDICPNYQRAGINPEQLLAMRTTQKQQAPLCNCQQIIDDDFWGYRTTSRDWYRVFLTHWTKQFKNGAVIPESFIDVAIGFPQQVLRHPGFYQLLPVIAQYCQSFGELSENLQSHLLFLAKYADQWIRPIEDFSLQEEDQEEMAFYKNLINHLFKQYETPIHWYPLLGSHYKNLDEAYQYFIHVAQGKNIRKLGIMPFQLSKRASHFFLHAPVELDLPLPMRLEFARRYAKIRVMNGRESLAKQLAEYDLVKYFPDEQLRHEILVFFINQFPEGHPALGTMLVYLLDRQRQEEKLNLKGVTAPSFLRGFKKFKKQIEESLEKLNPYERFDNNLEKVRCEIVRFYTQLKSWKTSKYQPFFAEANGKHIKIEELNNAYFLHKEGRVMGHCVGTYVEACYGQKSSIWSVKEYTKEEKSYKRLLTLEVCNGVLNEMRGRFNRSPNKRELRLVKQWLDREKIEIQADWLKEDFADLEA